MKICAMGILTGCIEHSMLYCLHCASRAAAGLASLLLLSALTSGTANAATTTIPIIMTITANCMVTAISVTFSGQSVLGSAIAGTDTVGVTYADTMPHYVGQRTVEDR